MKQIEFRIPATRGIQGGHTFFVAMCPIGLLPKLFPVGVSKSTDQSQQSFRTVSLTRVRAIAKEIVAQPNDYHLGTVSISIEHRVQFVANDRTTSKSPQNGDLVIPLEARLVILDGLDRVYGLQRALAERPSLAEDSVGLLIHVDPEGLRRGRIFSDIRRHEGSTAQSLRIGLDERDELARLTREMISAVPVFGSAIEMEKTAISNRSRKLFTLSALYQANCELLADQKNLTYKRRLAVAIQFWIEVSRCLPEWAQIVKSSESPAEIRANYIHCHGIGIAAIARAGRALLEQSPDDWKRRLAKLSLLDWTRANVGLWEGRAMIKGRLSKSNSAVALAGNAVKQHLGLKLTIEEQALES